MEPYVKHPVLMPITPSMLWPTDGEHQQTRSVTWYKVHQWIVDSG